MTDDKGPDEKILMVATRDPRYGYRSSLDQLNEHTLKELQHFFEVYKLLEPNKDTTVKGWEGRHAAETEILAAIERLAHLEH
jgi:inorganic pyrophosphatase